MQKELITIADVKTLEVFSQDKGLDPYVQQARDIVNDFEHDLSTQAGRKKTAALAAKVAKLKVKLDDMGKELVSGWKTKAKAVDVNRKSMRDALDELKVEARKPLTDLEEKEVREAIERIEKEKAEKLREQVESDHEYALLLEDKLNNERIEEERKAEVVRIAEEQRLVQQREEEDKRVAEAARLKAEQEAKEELERVEREKQAAIDQAALAVKQREEAEAKAKLDAEIAGKERIALAGAVAKKQIETEKINSRNAEVFRKEAKENAIAAAEKAKQDLLDQQQAEADAAAAKQVKIESNKKHIGKIRGEAKESIMALGIYEDQAKKLVLAIHNKEISNISISY